LEIILEKTDELNALVKVRLDEADYQPKIDQRIKEYARKAVINGFRPGKVPPGLIRKMYGKSLKVGEVTDLAANSLMAYLRDQQIDILGGPLMNLDQSAADIDWDNQQQFEFKYDVGLRPQFTTRVDKSLQITHYLIKTDDEAVDKFINGMRQMFTRHEPTDVIGEESTLYGRLSTADEVPVEIAPEEPGKDPRQVFGKGSEGYGVIDVAKLPAEVKALFMGKTAADGEVSFDLRSAFPTDKDVEELTGFEAERVAHLQGTYKITLQDLRNKKVPSLDADFFQQALGANETVENEADFRAKISQIIARRNEILAKDRMVSQFQDQLVNANDFTLPTTFLKRWLQANNDKLDETEAATTYQNYEPSLKWELLRNKMAKDTGLKVDKEDLLAYLREAAFLQIFNMNFFSMLSQVEMFAQRMANDRSEESNHENHVNSTIAYKLFDQFKEQVTITERPITMEEFAQAAH
jgi:trigger factor